MVRLADAWKNDTGLEQLDMTSKKSSLSLLFFCFIFWGGGMGERGWGRRKTRLNKFVFENLLVFTHTSGQKTKDGLNKFLNHGWGPLVAKETLSFITDDFNICSGINYVV